MIDNNRSRWTGTEGVISDGYEGASDAAPEAGQIDRMLSETYEGWGFDLDPEDNEPTYRYDEDEVETDD